MKKMFLISALLAPLMLVGCKSPTTLDLVKENLSELSQVYFSSGQAPIKVTICSGMREEPYIYDGKSCDKLAYALVIADLEGVDTELVTITIDGQKQDKLMEFNNKTGMHMVDMEMSLTGEEEISFSYMDESVSVPCESKNFVIDYSKALEIGCVHLSPRLTQLTNGSEFEGEAYLRIIDGLSGGFNDVFWLFSVLGRDGEMKNIIISTQEAVVLADGEQNMI